MGFKQSVKNYTVLYLASVAIAWMYFMIPFLFSVVYKDKNFAATDLGKLFFALKPINRLAMIWLVVAFVYFAVRTIRSSMHLGVKLAVLAGILSLAYISVFPVVELVNALLSLVYRNPPIMSAAEKERMFPLSLTFERNHAAIRDEYAAYAAASQTPDCIYKKIPGFLIGLGDDKRCWRAVYLKTAGRMHGDVAQHFPRLTPLLQDPTIHNAFFSILDPQVSIPPHTGYSKSYLRYHLGVLVPAQKTELEPYIVVGGERYAWREGEGVLFDDMYDHHVVNRANQRRVVLYIDVLRPGAVNRAMAWYLEHTPMLKRVLDNQHKTV